MTSQQIILILICAEAFGLMAIIIYISTNYNLNRIKNKTVGDRDVIFGETVQKVEIYYRFIGCIELPTMTKDEQEQLIRYFGRKKEGAA